MGCKPFGSGGGGMLPGMPGGGGGGGNKNPGGAIPGFDALFGDPSHPNIFKSQINYTDPLGPGVGGQRRRGQIMRNMFSHNGDINQATNAEIGGLNEAATNPGWQDAENLARSQISGDYLHGSPELDNAMASVRAAEGREFGDTAANLRDQYSRSGMSFGTGAQQAEQAARAAAEARASGTESAARLQNYQTERGIQQQSPEMLHSALSHPIDYLSQVGSAVTGPQTQLAQVVKGLWGNGQITPVPQDVVENPGILGQVFGTVGKL